MKLDLVSCQHVYKKCSVLQPCYCCLLILIRDRLLAVLKQLLGSVDLLALIFHFFPFLFILSFSRASSSKGVTSQEMFYIPQIYHARNCTTNTGKKNSSYVTCILNFLILDHPYHFLILALRPQFA